MDRTGQSTPPAFRSTLAVAAALASCDFPELDHDAGQVDEAFRLGNDALKIGIKYGSERVIQRARRFRREYPGPKTAEVREFDRHLRSTLV